MIQANRFTLNTWKQKVNLTEKFDGVKTDELFQQLPEEVKWTEKSKSTKMRQRSTLHILFNRDKFCWC